MKMHLFLYTTGKTSCGIKAYEKDRIRVSNQPRLTECKNCIRTKEYKETLSSLAERYKYE